MNNNIFIRLIVLAAFIIILFATYYYHGESNGLNFEKASNLTSVISAVISMLIGIVFGCLFRQLRDKNGRINIVEELSTVFSSSSFWSAIAASPIIFLGIFAVSGDNPEGISNYVLAFQNGFLCESVFRDLFPNV